MKRIIILAAVLVAAACLPASAGAVASCTLITSTAPLLTDNIQGHWSIDGCSAKTTVNATLQEKIGGSWVIADCPSSATGNCIHSRPGDDASGCWPYYCAYTNHNRTENYDQSDGVCSHAWRVRVTVYNPSFQLIGSANSAVRGPC